MRNGAKLWGWGRRGNTQLPAEGRREALGQAEHSCLPTLTSPYPLHAHTPSPQHSKLSCTLDSFAAEKPGSQLSRVILKQIVKTLVLESALVITDLATERKRDGEREELKNSQMIQTSTVLVFRNDWHHPEIKIPTGKLYGFKFCIDKNSTKQFFSLKKSNPSPTKQQTNQNPQKHQKYLQQPANINSSVPCKLFSLNQSGSINIC